MILKQNNLKDLNENDFSFNHEEYKNLLILFI